MKHIVKIETNDETGSVVSVKVKSGNGGYEEATETATPRGIRQSFLLFNAVYVMEGED